MKARDPEARALLRIARAIATLDLDLVVKRTTAMTSRALNAGRVILYLVAPDRRTLELTAASGTRRKPQRWSIDNLGPVTREVLRTGRSIVVYDYKRDRRFSAEVEADLSFTSFLVVPVEIGRERLGCLQVGELRRLRRFTRAEVAFARGIADQVAVAVKNARLAGEASARLELLRGLSARLFTVQEEERRRIARELHDEAGQALTAMKLNLELVRREMPPGKLADRLGDVSRLAQDVLEELRRIARDLRPRALDELGLVPALKVLVDAFRQRSGIEVSLDLDASITLSGESASTVFRFVQESLTNVVLHAAARSIRVRGSDDEGAFVFAVDDDGVGFEVSQTRGMGLLGMTERAALAGGRLRVASEPGRGTRVELVLPHESRN